MFCLPAGTYWLIYCSDSSTVDGGKAVTHKIQIRIESVLTTNKTSYAYGEPIMVTAIGEGADWFFIAPKHEDPSKHNWSIRWAYVCADKGTGSNKGAGSGVAMDIRQATHSSNFPDLGDIPPGEYSIFMVFDPNTGAPNADHGTRVDITVMGDIPDAPTEIQYTLRDKTTGSAGGQVTVSIDPAEVDDIYNKPSHVILYWGDAEGNKLEDYTYISLYKITGETVEISFADVVTIPEEADTLLACTYNAVGVSTGLASVALPQDRTGVPDKGDLLSSFQIVSDVHAQETQTHKYNQRIAQMLADIKLIDPDSAGIFIAGDSVNDGWVEEYENLYALWEESGLDAPIFMASGNHEWKIGDADNSYTSDYDREKDRFVSYVNKFLTAGGYEADVITDGKPYYDVWVNGYHYIFLASEAAITHAYLSDAQLAWLREKLAESRDANRPSFILIHQQLYNVVDGAMPIQDWDGVIAGDANYAAYKATGVWKATGLYEGPFREILAEFPEAMVFSGHSHWDMTDRNNIYDPANPTDVNDNPKDASGNLLYTETLPNYLFNTGSVAYLVSGVQDEVGKSYSNWDDSKGYYVRVYENCIEIWGREFSSSQWVPNAMYRIALTSTEESCTHADNAACATVCKDCGETLISTEQHSYDNACDKICNTCAEIRATGAHTGEYTCSNTCKHCGVSITPVKAHEGATACTDVCKYCSEAVVTPTANHIAEHKCSDACRDCQAEIVPAKAHEGVNTCSRICKYCYEPKATPTTTHQGEYECSDTCRYCYAEIISLKNHEGAGDCATVCAYCQQVAITPTADHAGEFACSNICKHCGVSITPAKAHESNAPCDATCKYCREELVTPTAQHVYSQACDKECSACGEIRDEGGHEGAFACSEYCKYCSYPITPTAAHSCSYACDADCAVCGASMMSQGHEGAYNCSTVCKHCGVAITQMGEHTLNEGEVTKEPTANEKGEKTYTCTDCGATEIREIDPLTNGAGSGSNTNGSDSSGGSDADAVVEEEISAGAVIGIVAGVFALFVLGGFFLYRSIKRKR